jgi:hypothetical protein
MDDWKETVEPALKERRSETKTHKQVVDAVIGDEISKKRQNNQDNPAIGVAGAEMIERQYRQFWKENPNATAEEALKFYQKLSDDRTLKNRWLGLSSIKINEAEAREREALGYFYDPYTNEWRNEKTGMRLEERKD